MPIPKYKIAEKKNPNNAYVEYLLDISRDFVHFVHSFI